MSTITCTNVIRISRGEGAPIGASNDEFQYPSDSWKFERGSLERAVATATGSLNRFRGVYPHN